MISPYFLTCLLLLPLGTCFPLLHRDEPVDARGGFKSKASCADLAGGHQARPPWGPSPWLSAARPHALPATAKEPSRVCAGLRRRFGRQNDSSRAAGFLPADGKTASSLLGTLAKELNGYNRKKGGFHFRFGRR
ncbi:orexigenic neuropeptide QRFP [Pteronotus mesoamericanus]|uniref:orexigenic neuropeptide QRFP n=1 Tax=Pteronotus mesoamericanus TaxID=1884717 RepID=UPI0023EC2954|nr:orexigenic neuropeptide QRFP [Pteronotus parnellii mesoamericanus]